MCAASDVAWPIYVDNGHYISPSIGFGPGGGSISASIKLTLKSPVFVSVLSDPQFEAWKPVLDTPPLEPNAMASTLTRAISEGSLQFDLSLTNSRPEEYRLLISLAEMPSNDNAEDDLRPIGTIAINWQQREGGSFLQYQFRKLSDGLSVIAYVLSAFVIGYASILIRNRRYITRLHFMYIGLMIYTLIFVHIWNRSVELERDSGDRSSWQGKWLPGLLEKGFDIGEVLTYLVTAVGWQTVRPQLYPNEVQFVVIGSGISFLLGVFELLSGDDAVESGNFTSARMIIHMFGYLAAIVGFNYHIAFGTALLEESSIASRDTARTYSLLNKFWWFRTIFLLFIIQPTIAVIVRTDILYWEDDWLFVTFFWFTKIALLVAVAGVFRPRPVERMALVELAIKERRRTAPQ